MWSSLVLQDFNIDEGAGLLSYIRPVYETFLASGLDDSSRIESLSDNRSLVEH